MKKQTILKSIFTCIVIVFVFQGKGNAQIGMKIGQSKPLHNFGANFSKAPTYELLYHTRYYNGRLLSRGSLSYTNFKPRQDTIPVFLTGYSNGYKIIYPGTLVFEEMSYISFSIDNYSRVFERNNFELLAGLGLAITKINFAYKLNYKTQLSENSSTKDFIGGGNVAVMGLYKFNGHLSIFGEYQLQYASMSDWSVRFPNQKIGFGLLYTINEDEEDY